MSHVIEVTDETFRAEVLAADMPVVVDFWAAWCRPCLTIAPWLDSFALDLVAAAKIVKANVRDNARAVADFGIVGLPTILVFVDGRVIARQNLAAHKDTLRAWIFDAVGGLETSQEGPG